MTEQDSLQQFHHAISAGAHNQAVDVLYSDRPSTEEIQDLIELAHVAHWHWLKRTDKTPQNVSVAQWLLSRAYSANGLGDRALRYAEQSLATIENEDLLPSFYGYCNEAMARAHLVLGDEDNARVLLSKALEIAETVPNPQAKEHLLDQINRIDLST